MEQFLDGAVLYRLDLNPRVARKKAIDSSHVLMIDKSSDT